MNFQAIYIPQGVPYPDEPDEVMDPGYYVTAGDEDSETVITLHVHGANDGTDDVGAEVALTVAAALNQSRFGGERA